MMHSPIVQPACETSPVRPRWDADAREQAELVALQAKLDRAASAAQRLWIALAAMLTVLLPIVIGTAIARLVP